MRKLAIRYGISRRNPETRKREQQNHATKVEGRCGRALLRRVLDHVEATHPGWMLDGFAPQMKRKKK